MRSKRLGVLVLVLGFVGSASAYASSITSHAGFSASETVITFNDVVGEGTVAVGGQYAAQGVTFSGVLYGYASSYIGITGSASSGGLAGDFQNNSCPCFNDVTVTFAGSSCVRGSTRMGIRATASNSRRTARASSWTTRRFRCHIRASPVSTSRAVSTRSRPPVRRYQRCLCDG